MSRPDAIAYASPGTTDASPLPLGASRVACGLVALVLIFAAAFALTAGDIVPFAAVWVGDGALVALWLLSGWGMGDALLRVTRTYAATAQAQLESVHADTDDVGDRVLRQTTALAVGLGAMSLATLLVGWAGLIGMPGAWAILLVGAALAVRRLHADKPQILGYLGGRAGAGWLVLLATPMLAISAVALCYPPGFLWGDEPAGYDVVAYHLQLPREWLAMGRVVPLTHNVFSFMPLNVEMHALLAMALRDDAFGGMYVAQAMCGTFVPIAALAAYGAVRRRGQMPACLAAIATMAFPWSGLLGGIAYNDAGLMLYATLAAAWALRGRWLLAGLCAGLAAGVKYTGVTSACILVPLVVAVVSLRTTRVPQLIRGLTIFALGALLTFSPWLVRNAIYANGNPLFPLALGTLGRAHFDAGQVERFEVAHAPRPDQQSLGGRAVALRDQVLNDWRWGGIPVWTTEARTGWTVPALLLLTIPAGLIARRGDRETWLWFGLIVGNVVVWLFATHLQGRFLTQVIPACAILLGLTWRGWRAGVMALIVCAVAAVVYREPAARLTNPQLRGSAGLADFRVIWDDDVRRILDDVGTPIYLVGDQRPFLLGARGGRVRYRSVFDVPSDVGFREAWLGSDVPADAWAIVTPSELERLGRTYRNLPPVPASLRGRGESIVMRAADVPER